jgi:hypothetical protein
VDDSLKYRIKQICKYVSNFKRKDNTFIQIAVGDQYVAEPKNIADVYANYFKFIFNTSCSTVNLPYSDTTDIFTYGADLCRCSQGYEASQTIQVCWFRWYFMCIIKGCSDIFIPLLTYISNLSIASDLFPILGEQTAVVYYRPQIYT